MQWRDWQRREDYYGEGVLLWLDVDMLLREHTGGKHSLADFAGAFFGAGTNVLATSTYTFADVCKTLNAIVPYDWAGYFDMRLRAHDDSHLLDGLARAGYRLVYTDEATEYFAQNEDFNVGGMDLSASLGMTVGKKGVVKTVAWEGPAFRAGVGIGARLTKVGEQPYSDDALKQAIKAASATKQPIALGFEADGQPQTASIPYYGSLHYPRLERIPGKPDQLERLLTR
jgi:predicted metalloprotease with PDZ domain